MPLTKEKCLPCETGVGKLEPKEVQALLAELNDWQLGHLETVLEKNWKFKDFKAALAFVNRLGALAEADNHHPDITFGWGYVMLSLTTHAAGGLTRNDFILAAKIDGLSQKA